MSILINKDSRILVQGITGHEGSFHSRNMLAYGSNIVAGLTPGKGGEWVLDGKVPVFDQAKTAVELTGADTSVIFVPGLQAADAICEAAESGIRLIICITEGIPIKDVIHAREYLSRTGARLIGPNCPGIITPGEAKAGIIPGNIAIPGTIGVVSRSGTLTYEVVYALTRAGIGVSTCVGIGGDPIIGTGFTEILEMFEADPHTDQVILIGEIGGNEEERAAQFIANQMTKPVIAFIAGQTAPPGRQMGHAGAIIEGGAGKASEKIKAFWVAGVRIASNTDEIASCLLK